MGDRSPKDKQKKQKQHLKEVSNKQQHRQENMAKNRHTPPPAEGETKDNQGGDYKRAG